MKKRSAYHYRRKSGTNILGGIFSLLLLATLGFLGWKLYPQLSNLKFAQFDRFNLAVFGKQTTLYSYSPLQKSLSIVRLPDDLYVTEAVHGYGQYKISSVYSVGNLDKRGGETAMGTLKEYLGVPIDGYYLSNQNYSDPKRFFMSLDFLFKANSSLSTIDRVRFLISILNIRFDRVKTIDLKDSASVLMLADGSNALSLEKNEVDSILEGFLTEDQVQSENYRVEVINTTQMAGLGARAVRLLTDIGLSVVNVETQDQTPLSQCNIYAIPQALKSLTVQRIANIYSCKIVKKDTEERAAITVKLGQDYADFLTK